MPEELWTEVYNTVQEVKTKNIPKKKKCKMAKWLCEESLEIAEKRRGPKCKGEGKEIPNGMQSYREWRGEIRKPS